jgi:hypothetical protein
VKLFRGHDGEWCFDLTGQFALDDERLGTTVVLIRLPQLVEKVARAP